VGIVSVTTAKIVRPVLTIAVPVMYVMMENARVLKHVSIVRKIVATVLKYALDLLKLLLLMEQSAK
jgi:hypothetical protein